MWGWLLTIAIVIFIKIPLGIILFIITLAVLVLLVEVCYDLIKSVLLRKSFREIRAERRLKSASAAAAAQPQAPSDGKGIV